MRRIIAVTIALYCTLSVATAAESHISRSEALLLVLNSVQRAPNANVAHSMYPDVQVGQWYTPYMLQAAQMGIFTPDDQTGLLYPHRPVTRAEFVKMLAIAFNLSRNANHAFTDVPRDAWYNSYFGIVEQYNLFTAKGDTHVYPTRLVSPTEATTSITQLKQQVASLRVGKQMTALEQAKERFTELNNQTRLLRNTPFQQVLKQTPASTTQTPGTLVRSTGIKDAVLSLFSKQTNIADTTKIDLLAAVNHERSKHGLPALLYNNTLEISAQAFAHDMWKRGYFSHFTPEGESFVDRMRSAGYMSATGTQCGCIAKTCSCEPKFSVGENIAKGQYTVEHVVREWMASPGHRRNILQTQFDEVGFGIYNTVWVQNFGSIEFNAVNNDPQQAEDTQLELVE